MMKEKRPLQVWLADDDEDDRMIFADVVQQLENRIVLRTVDDGQQLINLLTGNDPALPDIIFLDLNMPSKSGQDCLKEIKSNPAIRHLPVIIYSTSSAINDIREAYHLGASLYIQKPSNIKVLRKTLANVLSMDWQNGRPGISSDEFLVQAASERRHQALPSAGLPNNNRNSFRAFCNGFFCATLRFLPARLI